MHVWSTEEAFLQDFREIKSWRNVSLALIVEVDHEQKTL